MRKYFVTVTFLLLAAAAARGQYTDHRDHQLDSLEQVAAPWTADRIAAASREQKDMLDGAFSELMWGYLNINPSRSMYFARKALAFDLEEKWLGNAFSAARIIGMHHWSAGQIDSAQAAFGVARDIVDEMARKEPLPGKPDGYKDETIDDCYSALYGALGNMYASIDSIPQAMEYYRKAGDIFEKNGWLESSAVLYHNMGEIWLEEGDLNQAENCYKKALQYGLEATDSLQIAEAKAGLGALFLKKGRTPQALRSLMEADEYFSTHEDQEYRSRIYTLDLLGKVYDAQKRQRTWIATFAVLASVLLLAAVLILLQMLRTRRQLKGADAVIEAVMEEIPGQAGKDDERHGRLDRPSLTDREREILPLMAEGLTNKEIASRLYLTEQTIKWYRMRLNQKFQAKNATEVIAKAKESGII